MPENQGKDVEYYDAEGATEEAETMVKAFLVGDGDPDSSKQIQEDPMFDTYEDDAIRPPYNPTLWAFLMEKSTRLASCIRTVARNTVGLGYQYRVIDGVDPDKNKKQIEADQVTLDTLFTDPNDDSPWSTTMELISTDEESTGNGYLECGRNTEGILSGLYHAPALITRVRKKGPDGKAGDGFVQRTSTTSKVRYFKRFGDTRVINNKTGKIETGVIPPADVATEIIHFLKYSPRSPWYGIPAYAAAITAITGNRLAAERNVRFFDNDAVPRIIIAVAGGKIGGDSAANIQAFLQKEHKGVTNSHRALVIEAETKKVDFNSQLPKIDVTPITVGKSEDASFGDYRVANDEEIREAFQLAKVVLGSAEGVNRASAVITWQTTIQQVFDPLATAKEYKIDHTIVRDLGVTTVEFKFARPKKRDHLEDAKIKSILSGVGMISINEGRADIEYMPGLTPFEQPWANLPFPMAIMAFAKENNISEETAIKMLKEVLNHNRKLLETNPDDGEAKSTENS